MMSKQVKGFVLGALVGGVAALLFAPKSGRELRAKLTGKAEAAMDTIEQNVQEATKEAEQPKAEVNDALQKQADEIARQLRQSRNQGDLTPEEASDMASDDIVVNMDSTTETIPVKDAETDHSEN